MTEHDKELIEFAEWITKNLLIKMDNGTWEQPRGLDYAGLSFRDTQEMVRFWRENK